MTRIKETDWQEVATTTKCTVTAPGSIDARAVDKPAESPTGTLLADAGFSSADLETILALVQSSRRPDKGLWYDWLIAVALRHCGASLADVLDTLDISAVTFHEWTGKNSAARPVTCGEVHLALWGAMVDQRDPRLKALGLCCVWRLYHQLIDRIHPGADGTSMQGEPTTQEVVAILIEDPIRRATYFESDETLRDPEKATAAIQRVLGRGWSWGRPQPGGQEC